MGLYVAATGALVQLVCRYTGPAGTDRVQSYMYSIPNGINLTNTNGSGFYLGTRTSATVHKLIKNDTVLGTDTSTSSGHSNTTFNMYIAARNNAGSAGEYSAKECAFSTIGDGLTDAEATNLYTIVQKYQTTLGRQV
jgi:hypothetical protein